MNQKNKPNQTQFMVILSNLPVARRVGFLPRQFFSISNVTFQNGASRVFYEKRQKFIRLWRIYPPSANLCLPVDLSASGGF
jgi:hypothetical protein